MSDLSLDENSGGILIKGVDVTNLGGRVNTRGDRMRTQRDPDRLECWVKNNKIQLSRPKCKVWHLRAKKTTNGKNIEWERLLWQEIL